MMRLSRLPLLYQRALALLILAMIALIAYGLIVQPALGFQSSQGSASAQRQATLERLAKLSAHAPSIRDNIQQVLQDPRFSNGILPPSSPAQASAAIQARVRKCIQQAGGDIRTISTTPQQSFGSLDQVGISVTATMSVADFDVVLAQLEGGQPNLFIESIDMQISSSNRNRRADNAATSDQLIIRFQVVGFARREESS